VHSWQWFIAAMAFLICGCLIEIYTSDDEPMFTGICLMGVWGLSACCFFMMFKLIGVSNGI